MVVDCDESLGFELVCGLDVIEGGGGSAIAGTSNVI